MKRLFFLALGLTLISTADAGVRVETWTVGTNASTHEPQITFRLKKTKLGGFNLHNFNFTEVVWLYSLRLKGAADIYEAKDISVSNLNLRDFKPGQSHTFTIDSGSVSVNRRDKKVAISLQVTLDGKSGPFIGNGEYALPRDSK